MGNFDAVNAPALESSDGLRPFKAKVTMEIGDQHRFPKDTRAAVRWRNLLSPRFVYLYPGRSATRLGTTIPRRSATRRNSRSRTSTRAWPSPPGSTSRMTRRPVPVTSRR